MTKEKIEELFGPDSEKPDERKLSLAGLVACVEVKANLEKLFEDVATLAKYARRSRSQLRVARFVMQWIYHNSEHDVRDVALAALRKMLPTTTSGHVPYDCSPDCSEPHCIYCQGGLLNCIVCGGAEAQAPSECPGVRMTPEQMDAVAARKLDFNGGKWVELAQKSAAEV